MRVPDASDGISSYDKNPVWHAGGSAATRCPPPAKEGDTMRSARSRSRGLDEVRQEIGCIGCAQARDGVPSARGRVTWNDRSLIVADGHDVEISCVLGGIGRNLVQGRIDIAKVVSCDLVGDGDQTCPLRCAAAGATYNVPTDAAGIGT